MNISATMSVLKAWKAVQNIRLNSNTQCFCLCVDFSSPLRKNSDNVCLELLPFIDFVMTYTKIKSFQLSVSQEELMISHRNFPCSPCNFLPHKDNPDARFIFHYISSKSCCFKSFCLESHPDPGLHRSILGDRVISAGHPRCASLLPTTARGSLSRASLRLERQRVFGVV